LGEGPTAGFAKVKADIDGILAAGARFTVLPQFMHALLAMRIFQQNPSYDALMAELIGIRSLTIADSLLMMYPRMVCVDARKAIVPLTRTAFATGGCFLVHRCSDVILWVGAHASLEWIREAFGVEKFDDIPSEVPVLERQANTEINEAIRECWEISGRFLPVTVMRQGDPREELFREILTEDSTAAGAGFAVWKSQFDGVGL
jgi:hypothetical protein